MVTKKNNCTNLLFVCQSLVLSFIFSQSVGWSFVLLLSLYATISLLFLSIYCIQYTIKRKFVKLNIEVNKLNWTDQFIVWAVSAMFGLSVYCVDWQSVCLLFGLPVCNLVIKVFGLLACLDCQCFVMHERMLFGLSFYCLFCHYAVWTQ